MPTNRWRGDAPSIAQVQTITIGTNDVATTYKVTINGKPVSVPGNAGGANNTAADLANALKTAGVPQEFAEVSWSVATNVVTGTAAKAGKPFTLAVAVSGGSGTISTAVTTSSSGPNDAGIAANWSTGALPATGDDVVFDSGASDVLYGLDQHAVTPGSMTVSPGFTGKIGLPAVNADNASATYFEYRPQYLQYGTTGVGGTVDVTISGGAGRIKFDQGTAPAIWNVTNSAQRLEAGIPSVLLKGTNAANALNVNKGDVGVAFFGGEVATLLSLNVGYETNPAGDSTVWLGAGVTLADATLVQTGGNLTVNSATSGTATITQYDGNLTLQTGAQTGLAVLGGTCVYNSTGTLGGTPVIGGSGTLDFSQDLRAKTVTNPINLYGAKSKLLDPNKVVSSLVIDLNQLAISANLDIGVNIKLTRSTPP
ncbi:MAG TPA: hypothetical protein VGH74_06635 [Planctomycetaceae bacterium]|jgi:hypothetical protein